MELVGMEPG
ncbi:hypothetical protein AYI68_g5552, partial [Smittium mucronatum]